MQWDILIALTSTVMKMIKGKHNSVFFFFEKKFTCHKLLSEKPEKSVRASGTLRYEWCGRCPL